MVGGVSRECCAPDGPSRRTVLRGALGIAVAAGVVEVASRADAAPPAGTVTPTDITLTPGANPKPGDAVFGLIWFAGDTHVHDDHSSDGSFLRQSAGQGSPGNLSVGDQIGQGGRSGLAWMPLTDHRTYDQHWDPLWTSSTMLLMPGQEANGSPHAVVLGGIDEVVDAGNPPGSLNHRHVQQSIWETHAQGAAWGTAHPTYSSGQAVIDNQNLIGADWFELLNQSSNPDGDVDFAEGQWNVGFRTGVSGACDDHFKELWGVAGPGQPTTFVLASAATERALLDGLRAGRTTVGSNPTVASAVARRVILEADLDADGVHEAVGGDEVVARAGAAGFLRVTVSNAVGFNLIIYAAPGRSAGPLVNQPITLTRQVFRVPVTLAADKGWWRAEIRGDGGPAGLKTVNTGAPTVGPGVPNPPLDPTDQLLALCAPVFTTTSAPAVPVVPLGPPAVLARATADDVAAPVALGALGSFTGFPAIAVVGGLSHLVAERHLLGETHIVYGRGGDAERTISASTAARLPRVAANATDVYVVWEQDSLTQTPHQHDIWFAHSSDAGRSFGAASRLTSVAAGGRAVRPDVAVLADGTPVITWQQNGSAAAFDIFVVVGLAGAPVNLSGAGKTVAAASATDTRSASFPASLFPSVTALPGGGAVVAWQDNRFDVDPLFTGHNTSTGSGSTTSSTTDPDAWEPMVATLPTTSGTWRAPVRVNPNAAQAQRHPSIIARPDGALVLAWDSKSATQSSGSDPRLFWSASHDNGATWALSKPLDPPPANVAGTGQRPRLSLDTAGAARVVWHDNRASDWRWRVRAAVLDDGAGFVDARDVSTAGNSLYPAAAGGFTTWTTDRGAATQRDRTQRVVLASPAAAPAALPEAAWAVALPVVAVAAAAGVALARRNVKADVNSDNLTSAGTTPRATM